MSSIIVFIVLVASSAIASIGSYQATEREVVENLNTALRQAIAERQAAWLTPDTIASCRRMQTAQSAPLSINLRDEAVSRHMAAALRRDTFVQLRLVDPRFSDAGGMDGGLLCSDTIVLTDRRQQARIAVRSVAQCSRAAIFSMSDQRLPLALCLTSLLWATLAAVRSRRLQAARLSSPLTSSPLPASQPFPSSLPSPSSQPSLKSSPISSPSSPRRISKSAETVGETFGCAIGSRCGLSIGGLTMRKDSFFDRDERELHLTPMQRRLLAIFFNSPDGKLSQQDICSQLWPKKDDASETLYALMTRTKKAIEGRSLLKIEVDRGRGYQLVVSK